MSKILLGFLTLFSLLTACSDSDSNKAAAPPPVTPQPPTASDPATNGSALLTGTELVIAGIAVPPPPNDLANAFPAGVDTNSNGVRDDAERLVVLAYGKNAQQLEGAMQLAKRFQSILGPDAMDAETAQAHVTAGADEAQCLAEKYFIGDYGAAERANHVVVGAMLNTEERLRRYHERIGLASSVISIDVKKECK